MLSGTLSVSNECRVLPGHGHFDVLDLRVTEPFLDGRAAIRPTMPFNRTDVAGGSDQGVRDPSARLSFIPVVSRRQAFILSAEAFAPTAGDDEPADVDRGDFDRDVVLRPQGERWWITLDVTASHDVETGGSPASWEVAFGRDLAVLGGGAAANGYVRPGVGLGDDRPCDGNVEVGLPADDH